jgi:hypothetical protein
VSSGVQRLVLSDEPLNSSSKVQDQLPPRPSGVVPWQLFDVVVVELGGLVVVVVVLLVVVVVVVVVVVSLGDVVEVVVVGAFGAVVVVDAGGGGVFVLIVLTLDCAWSWNQEADAGPVERMGVTRRVAVTTAAEVLAKSAIARFPRNLSNTIPLDPPRFAAPPRCSAACGVSVREGAQRIQVL